MYLNVIIAEYFKNYKRYQHQKIFPIKSTTCWTFWCLRGVWRWKHTEVVKCPKMYGSKTNNVEDLLKRSQQLILKWIWWKLPDPTSLCLQGDSKVAVTDTKVTPGSRTGPAVAAAWSSRSVCLRACWLLFPPALTYVPSNSDRTSDVSSGRRETITPGCRKWFL